MLRGLLGAHNDNQFPLTGIGCQQLFRQCRFQFSMEAAVGWEVTDVQQREVYDGLACLVVASKGLTYDFSVF